MKTSSLYYFYTLLVLIILSGCHFRNKSGRVRPYQPQFHFCPDENWMGQPISLLSEGGDYHLFYEYNPDQSYLGNVHWGHAVSKDLIHWEDMPLALTPDPRQSLHSGTVVTDKYNTSGLSTSGDAVFLAYYIHYNTENPAAGYELSLSYSTDKGMSWHRYEGVLNGLKEKITRGSSGPKVFWHEETRKWIMLFASDNTVVFCSSVNGLNWEYESVFSNPIDKSVSWWEKPDLFKVKVSDTDEYKWVFVSNNILGPIDDAPSIEYLVGNFDGKEFSPLPFQEATSDYNFWMDYGKDCNSCAILSDNSIGRTIMIGWMNNLSYTGMEPGEGWSGSLTFPRELRLIANSQVYLLTTQPLADIETLYSKQVQVKEVKVGIYPVQLFTSAFSVQNTADISLTFDIRNQYAISFPASFGVRLKNQQGEYYLIAYSIIDRAFFIDRTHAGDDLFELNYSIMYEPVDTNFRWRLLIDNNSVEFFADDYRISVTNTVYPTSPFQFVEVFTEAGSISLPEASFSGLNPIW